jgi:hypothetical protein
VDDTRVHEDSVDTHYAGLDPAPHGCIGGYVFIGYLLEEDGEEREVIASAPCRRCAAATDARRG